jgi:catechol 2,3-dioxygenase-like lactoylglutathione lyase family enzyme
MSVRRVVPDLACRSVVQTTAFYRSLFGLQPVMDHGWIVTLAHPDQQPGAQLSLVTHDETAPVNPDVSIQVDDVDAVYAEALEAKAEIVHP